MVLQEKCNERAYVCPVGSRTGSLKQRKEMGQKKVAGAPAKQLSIVCGESRVMSGQMNGSYKQVPQNVILVVSWHGSEVWQHEPLGYTPNWTDVMLHAAA